MLIVSRIKWPLAVSKIFMHKILLSNQPPKLHPYVRHWDPRVHGLSSRFQEVPSIFCPLQAWPLACPRSAWLPVCASLFAYSEKYIFKKGRIYFNHIISHILPLSQKSKTQAYNGILIYQYSMRTIILNHVNISRGFEGHESKSKRFSLLSSFHSAFLKNK